MITANSGLGVRLPRQNLAMKMRGIALLMLVIAALPVLAKAQSLGDSEDFSSNVSSAPCRS